MVDPLALRECLVPRQRALRTCGRTDRNHAKRGDAHADQLQEGASADGDAATIGYEPQCSNVPVHVCFSNSTFLVPTVAGAF